MTIRPLCPELAEKARTELFEDEKRVAADIKHIQEWIAKQRHLRARTDDQWILTFLRGCKFSLERTKEKIELYYSMRTACPEFHAIKHTDPKFLEILDLNPMVMLPQSKDPTFPRVAIFRMGKCDPKKYNMIDIMSVNIVLQKIAMMEDDVFTIAGIRSIMDFEGTSLAHFTSITPSMMKKMVVFSQDAAPIRMKGAHYLNAPSWFEKIFNFFKTLLNQKNQQRLYVHNGLEDLYKYIPKEIMPNEYGGSAGTIQEICDIWKAKIKQYDAWLREDDKLGTDESKRVGKPKTPEDYFGTEGSFRQLEFD